MAHGPLRSLAHSLGGLVLLLGVSGCSKPQPPAANVDAAPPAKVEQLAAQGSAEDEVPPPPPAEVDAGPPAAAAGQASGPALQAPHVAGVCDRKGPCYGSITEDLESALGGKCRLARRCYETELANNPDLKGRVSVRVHVASNGALCSATVESDETGSPHMGACVASLFRGTVPIPSAGCFEGLVPCNFIRGGR